MTNRRTKPRDSLEATIAAALEPGRFINYHAGWNFVSRLEEVAGAVERLIGSDAERAARLYATFLAGCYEKADEIDDSNGNFGIFVDGLYCGWIKARQAAGADADETAEWLVARMENDPYAFAYQLERNAVKVMDTTGLAAFERRVKARLDAKARSAAKCRSSGEGRDAEYARGRWGEILRAIYVQQRNVAAYVALCQATTLSAADCLAIAGMLKARQKPDDALAWVERGLGLEKQHPYGSAAGYDLANLRRELLAKLGRSGDALKDAWAEFREHPGKFTYEELMRFVPNRDRSSWHAKAMAATADSSDLGALIELWMETNEVERLAKRLRHARDSELEDVSHYFTQPAAKRLAKTHPDVAAKIYRALGMRILNAGKSKYYGAALSNLEKSKRCFERAGGESAWQAVVAEVRGAHHRKSGFMQEFDRLVAGRRSGVKPSFLDRARDRWTMGKRQ